MIIEKKIIKKAYMKEASTVNAEMAQTPKLLPSDIK